MTKNNFLDINTLYKFSSRSIIIFVRLWFNLQGFFNLYYTLKNKFTINVVIVYTYYVTTRNKNPIFKSKIVRKTYRISGILHVYKRMSHNNPEDIFDDERDN